MSMASDFYLRYYVGHKGKFGHEFLEFEFRPDGERRRGREGGRAAQGQMTTEVAADALGEEWKGCVIPIIGGNDKLRFPNETRLLDPLLNVPAVEKMISTYQNVIRKLLNKDGKKSRTKSPKIPNSDLLL
ncbi:hypothetical protein A6R68_17612 [Neotoma lepida]|uniref:Small ribosomal subunit protein eS6 n=1 Tax=Neotoma lepida TaxID=56216 RepID=A0A1A6HDE0_NEOLE|nr:hypothetical protein A6R68_17612 [Neotoma lepida]